MLLKKGTIVLVLLVLLAGIGTASAGAVTAVPTKKTIADSLIQCTTG
jgi:hypothetical protein